MKLRSIHIVLIVILVVAIFVLTSSDTVVPYSRDTLFSHMYKYEGMEQMNQSSNGNDQLPKQANLNIQNPEPMTAKKQGFTTKAVETKKVEGFALQPSPFSENPVLDRYGSTPSGPQCFGKSSGYSNSLGPLCFSQEDVKLLSTRGGNISGTDSIIGR